MRPRLSVKVNAAMMGWPSRFDLAVVIDARAAAPARPGAGLEEERQRLAGGERRLLAASFRAETEARLLAAGVAAVNLHDAVFELQSGQMRRTSGWPLNIVRSRKRFADLADRRSTFGSGLPLERFVSGRALGLRGRQFHIVRPASL